MGFFHVLSASPVGTLGTLKHLSRSHLDWSVLQRMFSLLWIELVVKWGEKASQGNLSGERSLQSSVEQPTPPPPQTGLAP